MIRPKVLMPILLVAFIVVSCATAPPPEPNGEAKKEIVARESPTRETAPPATHIDKVVIGVLDFERSGPWHGDLKQMKKGLMGDLKRDTRVKLVDILDSCTLSDLKKDGYKHAERHKNIYQLDMILHVQMAGIFPPEMDDPVGWLFYFSLMDLYTKKVKEVSIETMNIAGELALKGISRKLLVSQDLNRVLRAKNEYLGKTR